MARPAAPPAVGEPELTGPADGGGASERGVGPGGPAGGPSRWGGSRALLGSVLVAVLAAGALVGLRLTDRGPTPPTRAELDRAVQRGVQRALQEQRNAPPDAATVYRTILPSLVTVVTDRSSAVPGEGRLGTGVLVSADGAILTALHVVDGAKRIEVGYPDGHRASARVRTRQPASDIAVLVPDSLPDVVVPAVLGGSAAVGDAVFAVGNPLGLAGSLTAGVVSAVDRSVPVGTGVTLKGLIQFDAAVNPGNSGGPLLNRDGQVVGIVTALANPARQPYFVGIGFAVPISTAGGAAGGPSI